jgi:23S rRNA (cytidine2498-2'-O)-methyltransferase
MPSTFLITASDEFENAARAELGRYAPDLEQGYSLAPGLFLVSTALDETDFATKVVQELPIYARHLFPVQATVSLTKTPDDLAQLAQVVESLPRRAMLTPQTPFAVQVRLVGEEDGQPSTYPYTPFAVKERLAAALVGQENIREPQDILSVVCVGEQAYLGLSPVGLNLSSWAGGMRRFARRAEQISRAEFKLEEALEVFGLKWPQGGAALDLGAAPGGWSRLLLEAGLRVTAVDPAALDPRLLAYGSRLKHLRTYAENFIGSALADKAKYRVITSDLRMDALQASRLLITCAPLLTKDGVLVASLKLPHETARLKPTHLAEQALTILRETYSEVRAHQLFHNRQEITVVCFPDGRN